jgi:exoribonuclease R
LQGCPADFAAEPGKYRNTLFVIELLSWPEASLYAHGQVDRLLGVAGDIEAETTAILLEHDVETEDFPAEVRCAFSTEICTLEDAIGFPRVLA